MSEAKAKTSNASEDSADKKTTKPYKLLHLPRTWIFLMTIRLLVNIFGQRGYIHPDEFFQGLEVIAGKLFKCEESIFLPWEFQFQNITNEATGITHIQEPIRNIAIPYVLYGMPLGFLKFLNSLFTIRDYSVFSNAQDNPGKVTPVLSNTLIYYPRVFMTICSLAIDFTILKSSELFGLDGASVLITFATSYISMVYLTRTFSNTIETMLFSILIYLIIKSITSQHIINDKFLFATESGKNPISTLIASSSDLVTSTFLTEDTTVRVPVQKAATLKRMRLFDIYKYDYLGSWIGLVICIGFFNRPTFIFFAAIPVAYWTLYGLESCNNYSQLFTFFRRRLLALVSLFIPCLVLLVLIDTIFYRKMDSLSQVIDLVLKRNINLIITPYNFFAYNLNSDNLKTHGAHPFYLHAVVNCVLLFGFNHLILYLIFFKFFYQLIKAIKQGTTEGPLGQRAKDTLVKFYSLVINNRFCFLLFSYLVPLMLFSLAPHQEPRFLLPLIIPVCLLTGHCIFGKNSYILFRIIWIIFNLVGFIFYGYGHQGGVVTSLNHVQKMFTHVSNLEMDQHVVYYQTYMPPRFLVMAPMSVNLIQNNRFVYEKNKKIFEDQLENGNFNAKFKSGIKVTPPERKIYDLMSSWTITDLENLVLEIKRNSTSSSKIHKNIAIFLVAPAVIDPLLNHDNEGNICEFGGKKSVAYQLQTQFKFHFSFEHLSEINDLINCKFDESLDSKKRDCLQKQCLRMSFFQRVSNIFSLNFYQVIL